MKPKIFMIFSRLFFFSLVSIFLTLLLEGCSGKKLKESEFSEALYKPQYATGFRIDRDGEGNSSKISIFNPWQGAENVTSSFLINRDSTLRIENNSRMVKEGAKRIACLSSTHIAMLDALDASDRIVAVSGLPFISNSYIKEHSDQIADIGYEGNIDYEKLLAAKPDLVLLYSVNGMSSMEPRLKELGIPFLYIGDYVEQHPIGKAEWIVVLGELVGKREEAIDLFHQISSRYDSLKEIVSQNAVTKPKVMLNTPYGDSWFMPSSESYVARLLADAGADYVYKKNTGNASMPIDLEEAFLLVAQSDFWLDLGTLNSISEVKSALPKFADSRCMKTGNLFNNNFRSTPGGGNDFYETGIIHPDVILQDLISIFHPEILNRELYYYHRLH